jgi:hypothetical protein
MYKLSLGIDVLQGSVKRNVVRSGKRHGKRIPAKKKKKKGWVMVIFQLRPMAESVNFV